MIRRGYTSLRSCLAFSFLLLSPQPDTFALEKYGFEFQSILHAAFDSILTEQQYWVLLKAADELAFQREFEAEFLLLLSQKEKTAYAELPSLDRRKAFIEFYWKSRNPDPLLPENDRLLDHLQRRAFARQHFFMETPPYFDDRGKYYIKYGKPMHRLQDIAGQKRLLEYKLELAFRDYSVLENESWSYVNVAPNFVVHFVKEGQVFKETQSLKELIIGGQRLGVLAWHWCDLLKRRFWMSPAINRTVTAIEDIEREMVLGSRGRSARPDNLGASQRIVYRLVENLEEADYETKLAKLKAPPTAFRGMNAVNKLPFSEAIAQFRGPGNQTRLEITLLSPLKNYIKNPDTLATDTVSVEYGCLLRDQRFDSMAGARQQIYFPAKAAAVENLGYAIGHLTILAPPQQAELALQVKNLVNDKIGFTQQAVDIRDFSGNKLMMSDLQFFVNVTNANQRRALPSLERQNVVLAPCPYDEVRQSVPLFCYFEIYNLQSGGLADEYTIIYKIVRDMDRRSVAQKLSNWLSDPKAVSISINNTRSIIADTANELIALDLGNLTKGSYRLEVTVTDTKDNNISVSAQENFKINE
ncbi:GWxTD domain-containing protein [candidate division KSB1 bacterium]|nr:GWxTD domain-containing protein [candidate division KSB1 bacterium]